MRLSINGTPHDVFPAGHESLLTLLHRLSLTGAKLSCGRGECGACTVLLDRPDGRSDAVYACLTLAAACEGRSVTTIEGVGRPGALHPMQQAFMEHDALQCGFCTPGQIMAAIAFAASGEAVNEVNVRRAMSGNLCRCGAQPKITAAVLEGAVRVRSAADGER
jgi:xanthine dehydrogenase YagT iron-sulfur-binding subunit